MNSKQKKTYVLSSIVIETKFHEKRVFQRMFFNGNFETRLPFENVPRSAKNAKALHEALVAEEIQKNKCEGVRIEDIFKKPPFFQTKLTWSCARKLFS